jgi:hypothetical protein
VGDGAAAVGEDGAAEWLETDVDPIGFRKPIAETRRPSRCCNTL